MAKTAPVKVGNVYKSLDPDDKFIGKFYQVTGKDKSGVPWEWNYQILDEQNKVLYSGGWINSSILKSKKFILICGQN